MAVPESHNPPHRATANVSRVVPGFLLSVLLVGTSLILNRQNETIEPQSILLLSIKSKQTSDHVIVTPWQRADFSPGPIIFPAPSVRKSTMKHGFSTITGGGFAARQRSLGLKGAAPPLLAWRARMGWVSVGMLYGLLAWAVPGWAAGEADDASLHQEKRLTDATPSPRLLLDQEERIALPPPPVETSLTLMIDKKWSGRTRPAVVTPGDRPPASASAVHPVSGDPSSGGVGGANLVAVAAVAVPLLALMGWVWIRRGKRHPDQWEKKPTAQCELSCLPASLVPLVGRRPLLRQLDRHLADPEVAVVTCVAAAGMGKTALVEGWLNEIQPRFGGAHRVFAWSFQSASIAHARSATSGPGSSGLFFARALRFFGHEGHLPGSEEKRAVRLSQLLHAHPSLLILDGVEGLQYPEELPADPLADSFSDPGLYHLLRRLCHPPSTQRHVGSLVVLTSRRGVHGPGEDSTESQPVAGEDPCRQLRLDPLTEREGVQLLKALGVDQPYANRLPQMVRGMQGHPLSLLLLGGLLTQQRAEWQPTPEEVEQWLVPGALGEPLQRLLSHYDQTIWPKESPHGLFLRLFGLFDRPMREEEWQAVRSGATLAQPLQALNLVENATLVDDLEQAGFLLPYATPCGWQLHPLVRDYFAGDLEGEYSGWIADVDDRTPDWENHLCQAHGVLFDYFQMRVDKEQPDGLVGLDPLYRAVQHGCRAGRYKEALHGVFVRRIRRGADYFSLAKWGAYSSDLTALAGFFPNGWGAPPVRGDLSIEDRAWLLAEVTFCLTAMGRVEEALGPQEEGLRLERERGAPHGVAQAATALCDLQMATGRLRTALETARQGQLWAEQHGLPVLTWLLQTKQAAVLHRLGEWSESLAIFRETEAVPVQITVDFLEFMGMAEKASIDLFLERQAAPLAELLERAERAREQAEANQQPLWIILSMLSKGRVLAAMGEGASALTLLLEAARMAEERDGETPLLADIYYQRAVILHQQGEIPAARWDLAGSLEIARRWGLPLLEVDGRLLEGEIFLDERQYPEAEASLSRADELILQTDYGQRRAEAGALRNRWLVERGG